MADGDVAGIFRSDMDPQDLPIETATFRGTWETQKGREMMSVNLRQCNAPANKCNYSSLALG